MSIFADGVFVLLQAGGRGERLASAGDGLPKPMVSVGGMPIVERLLRQLADAGARRIGVVVGPKGELLVDHLAALTDLPPDVELSFLRETVPLGNIGALRLLRDLRSDVLTVFADLVTSMDFTRLVGVHRASGADVTLASHEEPYRLAFGEIEVADDRVLAYTEKPRKTYRICSGVAVFGPRAVDLVPRDGPIGISDLVRLALGHELDVRHWSHGARWADVNTADDINRAERLLSGSRCD